MAETVQETRRLTGRAKFAVDFGPLLVFLIAYFFGRRLAPFAGGLLGRDWSLAEGQELFLAVGLFMPAFAVAFIYSVWKERRVAPMLVVSGVVIGVLGVLTLVLRDKTFFYMKPTIVYVLFAGILAAGLATQRNFLKTVFDAAFQLSDEAWRTLTIRYVWFFAALALGNEIVWRWLMRDCDYAAGAACPGEPAWVNIKIFGFLVLNLVFAAAQAPFIARHMQAQDGGDAPTGGAP